MTIRIEGDFETKSYADLQKVGAWAYSEDPTTDVICFCYGIDSAPIQEWWPGKNETNDIPGDLFVALRFEGLFEAHNASFELAIWTNVMVPKYGWPALKPENRRDSMAAACYYAMPAKLDHLARALKFKAKNPEGTRLISKYSKLYLKTASPTIPPADFRLFVDYCKQDVRIEQSVSDELGDLPDRELPLYLLDQKMNVRGLRLDLPGIETSITIIDKVAAELTSRFCEITGYRPNQRDRVIEWFGKHGLRLENMQAEYLEDLIENGDIPQGPARAALDLRLRISKAGTKKLSAMARQVGRDGRARFQTRYHGAQTGRNTGSGFGPLNMSRGFEKMDPEQLVRDIMRGDAAWLDALYGNSLDAIAKAVRYWIIADDDKRLMAGDYVSVEAVILACLAGEDWKVDAFRRGVKIYEHMADKIYGLPPGTVTKDTHPLERQDGKTGELAFGYQGALGAWLNFDNSGRHSDARIIEICKAWRAEHPAIVTFWRDLESAAIDAVKNPGKITSAQAIGFEVVDEWLSMILPDGKRIWYREPELRLGMPNWHQPATKDDCAAGTCDCRPTLKLSYMAQKFGQWRRTYTYGGKLAENATQATSRQVLAPATLNLEAAGYPLILTVYDEALAEVPLGHGSVKEFEDIMRQSPGDWARGWPLSVDAWEGRRYRK